MVRLYAKDLSERNNLRRAKSVVSLHDFSNLAQRLILHHIIVREYVPLGFPFTGGVVKLGGLLA